jgi:hypothetical protein
VREENAPLCMTIPAAENTLASDAARVSSLWTKTSIKHIRRASRKQTFLFPSSNSHTHSLTYSHSHSLKKHRSLTHSPSFTNPPISEYYSHTHHAHKPQPLTRTTSLSLSLHEYNSFGQDVLQRCYCCYPCPGWLRCRQAPGARRCSQLGPGFRLALGLALGLSLGGAFSVALGQPHGGDDDQGGLALHNLLPGADHLHPWRPRLHGGSPDHPHHRGLPLHCG